MIDSPIANIIAVVAVLEIQAERNAVTPPKANKIREGLAPIHCSDKTPKANRLSRSCKKIARAKMNDPMKRNISGSAKGAKTVFAGATLSRIQREAPINAVIGIGKLSQIHKTMIAAITAARL